VQLHAVVAVLDVLHHGLLVEQRDQLPLLVGHQDLERHQVGIQLF
jgi:hypothetical protein